MSGKDVWKWLLPKLRDEVLLEIYKSDKKIVLNGFRTNSVQDIASNRKRVMNNLLQPAMYLRLLNWAVMLPSEIKEDDFLSKKELNELLDIAIDKGLPYVLLHLFHEKADNVAINVYSEAKDKFSELLDIPSQSVLAKEPFAVEEKKLLEQVKEVVFEKVESLSSKETTVTKSENRKILKLNKKVDSLTETLDKMNRDYKRRLDEVNGEKNKIENELDEEKQRYKALEEEFNFLKIRIQKNEKQWTEQRTSNESYINRLEREIADMKEKEKEYKQEIAVLLEHNEEMEETEELKEDIQEAAGMLLLENMEKRILVIGEPAIQEDFNIENHVFSFLTGEEVTEFDFLTESYDEYWILVYTLSHREQFILGNRNETYIAIRNKSNDQVKLFNNYNIVVSELNKIERELERV